MTYSQRPAARSRYNYSTVAVIAAAQRKAERKRLARLRTIKRALHFIGFLCYWAVAIAVVYLVMLAVMIVCILLA